MKIPYKPSLFERINIKPRYIVIHDINCEFDGLAEFQTLSNQFRTGKLRDTNFLFNAEFDLNYHFVVEKVLDDYETVVGRPLWAVCEHEDIVSPYDKAFHVLMLGNFNDINPDDRFYRQMAYRAVSPLMVMFRIPIGNIVLHSEISNSKDKVQCPGSLFSIDKLTSQLKSLKPKK